MIVDPEIENKEIAKQYKELLRSNVVYGMPLLKRVERPYANDCVRSIAGSEFVFGSSTLLEQRPQDGCASGCDGVVFEVA